MFEENIDEKRVVTDTNMLLENVICPICYYILWKPIACGSCKNLLCRKCSDKNSNLCPFCRVTFQEQSPESNILSLLYNLRIRCYNSSNGCTDIVSYDLLEQHENLECKYISKKCHRCQQRVLIKNIDQHENLCEPIYRNECLQERSNERVDHRQSIFPMNQFLMEIFNSIFSLGQRPRTTFRNNLYQSAIFNQHHQQNYLVLFWILFKLIVLKPSIIHLVLLKFFIFDMHSFSNIVICILCYIAIWICFPFIRRHLILFVYSELSKNIICFVLTSINDTYFTLYLMLTSFISILINLQLSIHDFHLNNNFEKSLLCILLDFILPKLCLLMLRLFFEILPSFICTICWSLMVIFTIGSLF
ncbi:unnamed protein product [Rotaria sp. Silwood1]|nr:unnamed protein product [Rotaria sp. Silwood1]CAF3641905.1 unnamed protein product [Rotaria sp. Silwood1]